MISSEINVELTNVCSMDCDFCSLSEITRKKGFMSDDVFYKTIDEITSEKLTKLVLPFLMGESLLHKQWFEYLSYLTYKCNNSNISTCLVTNGAQLNKKTVDLLKKTELNDLYISCQQYNESGFDCRRIKQGMTYETYMSQVFNSVKDLSVNSNLKVSVYYLNTTSELAQKTLGRGYVDTNNKGSDIVSLWYEKFKKWGIKTYQLEDKIDISDNAEQEIGLTDNFSIIFKPFTTWGHVLRGDSYISPEGRKVYDISCSHIDGNTLAIFCDGQIGICCEDYDAEINFGNIRDISLVDVLNSKKYKNVISNFKKGIPILEKCRNCLNLS